MSFIRKHKKNGRTYLSEVENIRINGKTVQKHIRYIGKEVDSKTVLSSSISDMKIESVKVYGPLLVLNYLSQEIGISEILGKYGNEILSLVYAHCIDYKSINQMTSWFKRTDLNMLLNLNNLTESRLLKALDSLESQDLDKIQEKIFQKVKTKNSLTTNSVIYDVTNTYFYGTNCPLGKLGKDKEGVKGRPLIQIGLGVTRKEGIPIFHKTFDGNISDSRTLQDLISSMGKYKINNGIIIYDRGITSKNNLKDIKCLNWDTICGLASNERLKKVTREITSQKKLTNIKYRIKQEGSIFYVFRKNYCVGEIKGSLLICYNEQKEKDLRESRYDEILNAQKLLKKGKAIKNGLAKFFSDGANLNHEEITKAEEFDGFSYIFSTKKISSQEIIKLYFQDKDIVEKAFRSLKGIVSLRPIRHWLYNRVIAHVFICYLSFLLLSLLNLKLKNLEISPIKALRELDSLYKVYVKDPQKGFTLQRTVALTSVQEKILDNIDKNLRHSCGG